MKRTTENRQVTVLNCDLVNSVGLTLELGVEVYSDLLHEFFDRIRAAIQPWRGFEYSSSGDGVYFLFGYPTAEETAAENSARAALAILTSLGQSTRFRDRLRARIGIATSMLLFGTFTQQQKQDAIGDAMNRVERLQGLVDPNSIAISDETRLLLGDTFECESLGQCSLKGYSESLQAWQIIRERSSGTRFNKLRSVRRAPLIGRDHEWSVLNALWERAQLGTGQSAIVSGEAGIGKSRLVHDLVESLESKGFKACVLQCEPHLERSHLAPVAAYVMQNAGIGQQDSEVKKMEKLAELTDETFKTPGDEALTFLADFLSIRPRTKKSRRDVSSVLHLRKLLGAVIRMLVGTRQDAPQLIVIEDMHWADDSTLELVDRLIETASDKSTLLILTSRGLHKARMLTNEKAISVPVSALSETDAETLISELTSGPKLPASQVRAIMNWSDGVPLDIEEHTRIELMEWAQRFSGESSVGSLAGDPGHIGIPLIRRDAIKSYLDRLGSFGQRTAQAAAAIGQEFSRPLLKAALSTSHTKLDSGLQELESAAIIHKKKPYAASR